MNILKILILFIVLVFSLNHELVSDFRLNTGDKVSSEVELMYVKGIKYLMDNQNANGTFKGSNGSGPGVVGLCITAILAHGDDPNYGPYRNQIKNGIDFIIKNQDKKTGYYGGSMYHHGFATLAMAEAYGALNDKRIGKSLKLAVDLLLTSQSKNSLGGWRYTPETNSADTTISGACLVALLAARNSGIGVPQKNLDKALTFYKKSQTNDGGIGYTNAYGPNNIRTAIGILVYALAKKKGDVLKNATKYLKNQPGKSESHFYYFSYYNSQALFRTDPKYWAKWNEIQINILKQRQLENGSWSGQNGTPFSIATALLSLALNYRYLPIYER